ncbi:MAG: hypothetical protein KDA22_04610 [Phycisphaerales bacterium]|nr:hypothetical protein [Phycisphaerales bacterium]
MNATHQERNQCLRRATADRAGVPVLLLVAVAVLGGGCATVGSSPSANDSAAATPPPPVRPGPVLPGLVLPSEAQALTAERGGTTIVLAPDDPLYARNDRALIGDGGARELPTSAAIITLDDWQWTVNGSPRDHTRFRTRSVEASTRR